MQFSFPVTDEKTDNYQEKKHCAVLVDFVMSRLNLQIDLENNSAESGWKRKVDKEALYACLRDNLVIVKPEIKLAHLPVNSKMGSLKKKKKKKKQCCIKKSNGLDDAAEIRSSPSAAVLTHICGKSPSWRLPNTNITYMHISIRVPQFCLKN